MMQRILHNRFAVVVVDLPVVKNLTRCCLSTQPPQQQSSRPHPQATGPSLRPGGNFSVKGPGLEGKPAQRTTWPTTSSRNQFFAGQPDSSNTHNSSSVSKKQTAQEAKTELLKDLKQLHSQNPGLNIDEKSETEFVLKFTNRPDVCLFRVVVNGEDELGFESSSSPGIVRSYTRDEFGQWNSTSDGHNLHGLFLRDLLPYIKGLPKFASQ